MIDKLFVLLLFLDISRERGNEYDHPICHATVHYLYKIISWGKHLFLYRITAKTSHEMKNKTNVMVSNHAKITAEFLCEAELCANLSERKRGKPRKGSITSVTGIEEGRKRMNSYIILLKISPIALNVTYSWVIIFKISLIHVDGELWDLIVNKMLHWVLSGSTTVISFLEDCEGVLQNCKIFFGWRITYIINLYMEVVLFCTSSWLLYALLATVSVVTFFSEGWWGTLA